MKTLRSLVAGAVLLLPAWCIAAEPPIAELEAADDARIAAVLAADAGVLSELLSDELHYGHSSGGVDTKASFIESLVSGRVKYVGYENQERKFTFLAPEIALMSGRAQVKVESPSGGMDSLVGLLAVWQKEAGKWRFRAWQSCRVLPKKP